MEVMVPLPAGEFNNYFFSAPSSPCSHSFNRQISFSFFPISTYVNDHDSEEQDDENKAFAFNSGGDLDLPPLSSADELFDGGKIKPCEPKLKKILQNTLSFDRNNKVCSEKVSSSSSSFGWLYKKLKLKDLLFRSASEGHETNKKYDFLSKFTKKKNKRAVATLSAHEQHYKVNRAAAEEMRKKTFLPYKQTLMMGCMDLDAAGVHHPSRAPVIAR